MKKYVSIKSAFFLCLFIHSILAIGGVAMSDSTKDAMVVIKDTWSMEVTINGQPSEDKIIVTLQIQNINKPFAVWDSVYIKPEHDNKRVLLRATHFSTTEGSIRDVMIDKDSFSFQISPSPTETIQIVGTKNAEKSGYSVQGVGLVYLRTVSKRTKIEWRSTDRKFILPYKEVY